MHLWRQLEGMAGAGGDGQSVSPLRYHGTRIALAAALAVVTYFLFPSAPASEVPLYEVGSVASENVIAPFAFAVNKDRDALRRERDELAKTAEPVLVYVPAALDSANRQLALLMKGIDSLPSANSALVQRVARESGVVLTPQEASYLAQPSRRAAMRSALERDFSRWLSRGVVPSGALDTIRGEVIIRRGEEEQRAAPDSIATFSIFVSRARLLHPDPRSAVGDAVYTKLLGTFFHPTLALDRAATAKAQADLRASVPAERYSVREGEKIVGAHEVVGRAEYEKLRGLQLALQEHRGGENAIGRVVGSMLFNFMLLIVVGLTLMLYRPQLYRSIRALILVAVVFLVVLTGASVVSRGAYLRAELVPIALASVLLAVIFDSRIAMIASTVLAVLVGSQAPFRGTNALFIGVVAGAAAAFSVRALHRRNEALAPIVTISASYLCIAVALGLMLDWTGIEILKSAGWGALNALICVPLAMALLPLAEDFTGIDTYLRLLEWSDLNRPLMRRLSLEAPGTYSHTMRIADLAEAAANAIGANGLLARVGAYYHDIGKLKKPQYFIENQQGKNPHEKLKPQTSAGIIRNHIDAGLELADKEKLPQALRSFITEHHGTGSIAYFLEKAKERDPGSVNPAEFTYPGPTPQSAETAIVMLADGVEASTRVIADPTPEKLRGVIDHIVRQRIDGGQLRNAPLTLRQIELVKEQFARSLIGQHHHRTDYPASSGGVTAEFNAYEPRR
ncbi:MAG: HDIG domain-containing protein [Gemmatimonadaceae bacterium]|nr:HDIG domain-containing protein [Gemmatimonadaceae bacterium]NUQ92026.1 HDIG domain-containing protein [Gemmatimonadaceae bacterium]NUS98228.1 HDIG domain-containing protein [Gemmatimonadaceae bacterium]